MDEADLAAISADGRHNVVTAAQGQTDNGQRQAVEQASKLVAQLCYQQLPSSSSVDPDECFSTVAEWVSQLSHQAAAAALFAAWQWAQPGNACHTMRMSQQAVGILCLELYHAARSGKPTLDSLLLDIGLAAAAAAATAAPPAVAAQQWKKGELQR